MYALVIYSRVAAGRPSASVDKVASDLARRHGPDADVAEAHAARP